MNYSPAQEIKSRTSASTCCVPSYDSFLSDVMDGLSESRKSLPCKYLYDTRGSALFDRICELDEYYPTRTEIEIMQTYASEMAACLGEETIIMELGSGSSLKSRILLDHLYDPSAYLPVDISDDHLINAANQLRREYPAIDVVPIIGDFMGDIELPSQFLNKSICTYFPGSTIGNLLPLEAFELLHRIANRNQERSSLLIGFDLQKDVSIIEKAYNDSLGVTAAFNLNLLRRINRELGGDFELSQFAHVAKYNVRHGRVEIYVESLQDQTVMIANHTFQFREGERVLTEYSHKYTREAFAELAEEAGFKVERFWTDPNNYFAVALLVSFPGSKHINMNFSV